MAPSSVPGGRIGIWSLALDRQPYGAAVEAVQELEELGFASVWVPDAMGRDAITHATMLLAASRTIAVGTGVATIWSRDPTAMNATHRAVSEAFPGRFLLGLGVSHRQNVERRRKEYAKPIAVMRAYLDAMDESSYASPPPPVPPCRLLGAMGPQMLRLAAERANGVHPYRITVEHTAWARTVLGEGPLLIPDQGVIITGDAAQARSVGRQHLRRSLQFASYRNNFLRLGFTEDDLDCGGSDRLIDAVFVWGGLDTIRRRVADQLVAGADQVAVQVVQADETALPRQQWRDLADALLDR